MGDGAQRRNYTGDRGTRAVVDAGRAPKNNHPDETLIASTRTGDGQAFAELWRRHYRSGVTVARQFTSIDADDLVSEAFARIYKCTVDGGGPTGAFRPYLYTTIRNLACTWGSKQRDVQVDEIDLFAEVESAEEPVARWLDRQLVVRAYGSLPARWQTVLWYSEVESLDPHEIAPIMGLSSNSVAALAYRAREGLRKAWLQAHVNEATASGACQWVVTRLGDYSRHSLTDREQARLTAHLDECERCMIVCDEVNEVGAQLAMAMLPILLGTVAGGTLLATLGSAAGAGVATAAAVPALPASIGIGAAASTAVVTTASWSAAGIVAIAASTVIVAAASLGAIGATATPEAESSSTDGANSAEGALDDPLGLDSDDDQAADSGTAVTTGAEQGGLGPADLATTVPGPLSDAPTIPADTLEKSLTDTTGTVVETVDRTVDDVTDTVDKVGDTVDKVGGAVDTVVDKVTDKVTDKVVDKVLPSKPKKPGSQVGAVVDDTTDAVAEVTDAVDTLVGGLLGGGKKK